MDLPSSVQRAGRRELLSATRGGLQYVFCAVNAMNLGPSVVRDSQSPKEGKEEKVGGYVGAQEQSPTVAVVSLM